jgi:ABC-type bacteriocin/lantibiotic exporter with double-glycine peptidase domain
VAVRDISFTYDGQYSPAISRLQLEFQPGERVAIVGPNGAGKSTLTELLFGQRAPEHGWIEIDGADLRTLKLETLREHVALVKGIEVIEGTVLDNVRMGRDTITQADVRDALRRVGLLDTILALPDGLETMLWAGGSPLSLGQANRLMVGRAIVGQPRLLILDEALDHMDADIRETVVPAILDPGARWTLLVVTHSEEVARLCDRVVELKRPTS